jgi:class 3 adenylate cyclase
MSILFAATYPERTRALVLCGTYASINLDPDRDPAAQQWGALFQRVESTVEHWGDGSTIDLFAPSVATERERIARGILERSAASPQMARLLMESNMMATDVADLLPSIQVPTLVLHREEEIVPLACGRHLAEHIPGAKLVVLPGADHIPFYGDADGYAEEIEEFLTGVRHMAEPDRALMTVMFTDIVASTEQAAGLGDARWRELITGHDELVRSQIERFRGRAVKTMGDGFLATFDGPARAIRCARSIEEAVRPLEVQVRAGLHTGECELVGDDISGMAVNICARIGALARGDEVLVSRTVKDLVVGSGITFRDRGMHQLRGVPGEWQLYGVDTVEAPGSNRIVPDMRERRLSDRVAISAARRSPKLMRRMMGLGARSDPD